MRLQRLLAIAGVASRRKAEELITSGRVSVNGRAVTELGVKADPTRDRVELDGKVLASEQKLTVIMNKPRGVVCTASDPEGRPTVLDLVRDSKARLFPVGRLDFNTSGALLLTNDGELSFALTHPKHGVEKVYEAKVRGFVAEAVLGHWRKGVDIGEGVTAPAEVCRLEVEEGYTWLQITLKEGRNRQIRRMAEATGLEIIKLKRSTFAGIGIEGLRPGQYRELTEQEMERLVSDHVPEELRSRVKQKRGFVANRRTETKKKGWGKPGKPEKPESRSRTSGGKARDARPTGRDSEEAAPRSSRREGPARSGTPASSPPASRARKPASSSSGSKPASRDQRPASSPRGKPTTPARKPASSSSGKPASRDRRPPSKSAPRGGGKKR